MPILIMCNRGRTNDDGKCRFHPSIQLNLLNRNGKWVEIMKDCPLCLAFKMKSISCKSNPILTTPKKSSRFSELKDGDELPSSAAIKDTKASSSTSCVIPVTYDRLAIQFPPLPLSTTRHNDSDFFDTTLAVCRMNDEVCYVTTQKDCLPAVLVNNLIQEVSQSKRLMTRSKFEEEDRSDRTGSTHSTSSTTKSSISKSDDHSTESSISKSDDHSHKRSKSTPISCIRKGSTLSEGSKRSLNRVVFAEQDDIHVFVRI